MVVYSILVYSILYSLQQTGTPWTVLYFLYFLSNQKFFCVYDYKNNCTLFMGVNVLALKNICSNLVEAAPIYVNYLAMTLSIQYDHMLTVFNL